MKKNYIVTINLISKQILIIFFYYLLIACIKEVIKPTIDITNVSLINTANLFMNLLVTTIFILLFRKVIIPDFYDFKKNFKKYISSYYHIYIIGLILLFVSNSIISMFTSISSNESLVRASFFSFPLYYFPIIIFCAPITEELLTRVTLKDAFKNKYIYYILSGLVFGFLHVSSYLDNNLIELVHIIPYALVGASLAIIYNKSDNVWTNIFFHSLHNLIAIILLLLVYGGLS